jgi:hypothetical protein
MAITGGSTLPASSIYTYLIIIIIEEIISNYIIKVHYITEESFAYECVDANTPYSTS